MPTRTTILVSSLVLCACAAADDGEGDDAATAADDGAGPSTGPAADDDGDDGGPDGPGPGSGDDAADDAAPSTESGDAPGDATGPDDSTTGAPTGGCGSAPGEIAGTIDVDGLARTFVLSVPDDYDPNHAYPLVFAWHGLGGDGALAKLYFGIEQQAGGEAIFVYPDGLPVDAGGTGWELTNEGRDVALFDALLAQLSDDLCIDSARVFSTGHSFGGFFSNTLGCARGDMLAAIAPVSGGGPFSLSCSGPVKAWLAHGTADATVPIATGINSRDQWLATDGCGQTTAAVDPDPCIAYEGCTSQVVWCQHGGGHEWPAFAAAGIWGFFAAQ